MPGNRAMPVGLRLMLMSSEPRARVTFTTGDTSRNCVKVRKPMERKSKLGSMRVMVWWRRDPATLPSSSAEASMARCTRASTERASAGAVLGSVPR